MRTQLSRAPRCSGRIRSVPRGAARRSAATSRGSRSTGSAACRSTCSASGCSAALAAAASARSSSSSSSEDSWRSQRRPWPGEVRALLVADGDQQRPARACSPRAPGSCTGRRPRRPRRRAHAEVDGVRRAGGPGDGAADVEVAVGVEVVDAGEHLPAADVVPGPVERRRAVATAQVLVGEQRGQVDHDDEPTSRRRQARTSTAPRSRTVRQCWTHGAVLRPARAPQAPPPLRPAPRGGRGAALVGAAQGAADLPAQDRLAVAVGDHDLDHLRYEDADKGSRTSAGGRTRTAPTGGCCWCCTAAGRGPLRADPHRPRTGCCTAPRSSRRSG